MSTFQVTAEQLVIHPHPNADLLELAQVGLFRAVVGKGQYKTGDWAIYIPEQAVLPEELIEELGLVGKLAGKLKNRVKAVRLRGEISQGIVCTPEMVLGVHLPSAIGFDFSELLDIVKWVPPIPVHMSGKVVPAPDLMRWIDVENIKRYPQIFEPGEPVVATEKIHGTCCLYTWTKNDFFISSKGFGSKNLALEYSGTNLYWRAIHAHDVHEIAETIAEDYGASRVGIFGEVYGKGVQDLDYGAETSVLPGYAVFDIRIEVNGVLRWLNPDELNDSCGGYLPLAPVLYYGGYDEEKLLNLAEGMELVSGTQAHIREGIVVRARVERYSPITGGRAIAKFVSDSYLTRHGATEYE